MKYVFGLTLLFATVVFHGVHAADDDDITFAPKAYFDDGQNAEVVAFSGTLSGEGVAYRNNTQGVTCLRQSRECWISSIEQIGLKQIGRMDSPYRVDISKWSASEIVAGYETSCAKTTVTISRNTKTILWVQEPINQARPECLRSDTKLYKWTIEDSLGWKRIHAK